MYTSIFEKYTSSKLNDLSNEQLVKKSLESFKNYIETGSVDTSLEDLYVLKQLDKMKDLPPNIQKLCARLDDLITVFENRKVN